MGAAFAGVGWVLIASLFFAVLILSRKAATQVFFAEAAGDFFVVTTDFRGRFFAATKPDFWFEFYLVPLAGAADVTVFQPSRDFSVDAF